VTVDDTERARIAAHHLSTAEATLAARAGTFALYRGERAHGRSATCIVDERGIVRAIIEGASIIEATTATSEAALRDAYERYTRFGDVGRALPDLRLVYGARIADLSGVSDVDQAIALAHEELAGLASENTIVLLAAPRHA
jgi:hypothetical protein